MTDREAADAALQLARSTLVRFTDARQRMDALPTPAAVREVESLARQAIAAMQFARTFADGEDDRRFGVDARTLQALQTFAREHVDAARVEVGRVFREQVAWVLAPASAGDSPGPAFVNMPDVPGQRMELPAGARTVAAPGIAAVLEQLAAVEAPTDGRRWAPIVARFGAAALLEAMATLVETRDVATLGGSTLAMLGDLVARAMRRDVLRAELEAARWNLARCSDRLRMGGSPNVIRAIRDLGLVEEYEAAKRGGLVRAGARRKSDRPGKPDTT